MSEEKWYRARQFIPGAIIRCQHEKNPACICVTRFDVDKNCPLTKRQRIVSAASLELDRMKRLEVDGQEKCHLLSEIILGGEDIEMIYDNRYQLLYGSLTPNAPVQPQKGSKLNLFLIVLIVLILLPMGLLLITVHSNSWDQSNISIGELWSLITKPFIDSYGTDISILKLIFNRSEIFDYP